MYIKRHLQTSPFG